MNESTPKPMSATLPASKPEPTATQPSIRFQPMVTYSSRRPRRTLAVRAASGLMACVLVLMFVKNRIAAPARF
jgi:hypothetical protein